MRSYVAEHYEGAQANLFEMAANKNGKKAL